MECGIFRFVSPWKRETMKASTPTARERRGLGTDGSKVRDGAQEEAK
jgi:hypothetical protein